MARVVKRNRPFERRTKGRPSWKKRLVVAGVVAAVGIGGVAVKSNLDFRKAVSKAHVEFVQSKVPVRDLVLWSKLGARCHWSPLDLDGKEKIELIEAASVRSGVSPARVLLTLKQNGLNRIEWRNRLATLEENPEKNVALIEQVNRVLFIFDVLYADRPLSEKIVVDLAGVSESWLESFGSK